MNKQSYFGTTGHSDDIPDEYKNLKSVGHMARSHDAFEFRRIAPDLELLMPKSKETIDTLPAPLQGALMAGWCKDLTKYLKTSELALVVLPKLANMDWPESLDLGTFEAITIRDVIAGIDKEQTVYNSDQTNAYWNLTLNQDECEIQSASLKVKGNLVLNISFDNNSPEVVALLPGQWLQEFIKNTNLTFVEDLQKQIHDTKICTVKDLDFEYKLGNKDVSTKTKNNLLLLWSSSGIDKVMDSLLKLTKDKISALASSSNLDIHKENEEKGSKSTIYIRDLENTIDIEHIYTFSTAGEIVDTQVKVCANGELGLDFKIDANGLEVNELKNGDWTQLLESFIETEIPNLKMRLDTAARFGDPKAYADLISIGMSL